MQLNTNAEKLVTQIKGVIHIQSSGATRGGGGLPWVTPSRGDTRTKKLWANLHRIVDKRSWRSKKKCGVTPSRG